MTDPKEGDVRWVRDSSGDVYRAKFTNGTWVRQQAAAAPEPNDGFRSEASRAAAVEQYTPSMVGELVSAALGPDAGRKTDAALDVGPFAFNEMIFGAVPQIMHSAGGNPRMASDFAQKMDVFKEENPGASVLSSMAAGAALPGVGAIKGTRAARALWPGLSRASSAAIPGTVAAGAAGAATGFFESYGADPADRILSTGIGAAIGTGAGFGLQALGQYGLRAVEKLAGNLDPQARWLAQRDLQQALAQADFDDPDQLAEEIARYVGEGGTVADLDANLAARARTSRDISSQLDNEGRLAGNMQARASARGDRISDNLRDAVDLPFMNVATTREAGARARQAVRDEWYAPLEEQFGRGAMGPELRRLIEDKRLTGLLNDVNMASLGARLDETAEAVDGLPMFSRLADDGVDVDALQGRIFDDPDGITFRDLQDVYITVREAARNAQALPGVGNRARVLQRELESAMDNISPEMRVANRQYRNVMERWEAIQDGSRAANRNVSPEDLTEQLESYATDEARTAYRVAWLQGQVNAMGQREGAGANGGLFMRPGTEFREKVDRIIGDDVEASRFWRRMRQERRMASTESAILGGSRTADATQDVDAVLGKDTFKNVLITLLGKTSDNERELAETILGDALGSDGSAAAALLAQQLGLWSQRAGGLFAALGAGTANVSTSQLGGELRR